MGALCGTKFDLRFRLQISDVKPSISRAKTWKTKMASD